MGHTAKSARFTGLLGLMVLAGLLGLGGTGDPGDSTLPPSQNSFVNYSPLQFPLSYLNSPVATGLAVPMAPVSSGYESSDGVGTVWMSLLDNQTPRAVPDEVSMIDVTRLRLVSFSGERWDVEINGD